MLREEAMRIVFYRLEIPIEVQAIIINNYFPFLPNPGNFLTNTKLQEIIKRKHADLLYHHKMNFLRGKHGDIYLQIHSSSQGNYIFYRVYMMGGSHHMSSTNVVRYCLNKDEKEVAKFCNEINHYYRQYVYKILRTVSYYFND